MLKHTRNIVSMILTIALVLGMTPVSAFAEDSNPSSEVRGEITAFAELDESVANQSFENVEQMNLEFIAPPETLNVTVRLAGSETASPATTGGDTVTMDIPVVEWKMTSHEETGSGGYIIRFTAVAGAGFTLAEGVAPPQITVTVGQMDTPEITTFADTVDYTLYFKNGLHGWNLYKGDTNDVYDEPANAAKWRSGPETLELDGFRFDTNAEKALIIVPDSNGLTAIQLLPGTSAIRTVSGNTEACGIYTEGSLIIMGDNTAAGLTVLSGGENDNILRYGIHVKGGSLTVDKATVKALCEEGDGACAGIYIEGTGGLNITDGVVHAAGGVDGDDSFGLLCGGDLNITGKSILRAFGGENAASVGGSIPVAGITITDEENNVEGIFDSSTPKKTVQKDDTSVAVKEAKIIPANAPIVFVEFDGNGGNGQMPPVEIAKNAQYTLPENDFDRAAYRFTGWKVNNAGDMLPAGTTITMDDYKTLWAQWVEDGAVTNIAYGSPATVDGVTFTVAHSGEEARVIRVLYGTNITLYVEGASDDPPLITAAVTESAPAAGVHIQFIYEINNRPNEESIEIGSKVILRARSRASVSASGNYVDAMENGVTVTLMDWLDIGNKHTEFRETEVSGGAFGIAASSRVILTEGLLHKYASGVEFDLSASASKVMMSCIQQGGEGDLFAFDNIDENNAAVVHASSDTGLVVQGQKMRFAFNIMEDMAVADGSSVKLRENDDALFFYSGDEGYDHTHFTAVDGGAKIERYADKAKIVEGKAKAESFLYDPNYGPDPALPLVIAPNRSLSLQDSVEINAGADAVLVESEYGNMENSRDYIKAALSPAGGTSLAGGTVSAVVEAISFDELKMKNGFSAANITVDKSAKLMNLDAGNNKIRLTNNGTIQNAIKGVNGAQISLAKAGAINKSNIYDSATGNVVTSLADGDLLTYDVAKNGWVRTVPNTVTINFDANGGSGYQAPATIAAGNTFILPSNSYTRSGYLFGGWKIDDIGGLLLPGTPVTVNADITLYAQWTPLQSNVTIAFNANGGSGSQSPAIMAAGGAFTLPANPYTRSGYLFGGWKIDNSGGLLLPGTSVIASADFTLYAQWTQIGSTVIIDFNANGGSGSQSPAIIVAGSTFTLPASPYTRSGYLFRGWKVDNSGNMLMSGTSITASADFTLYAQWTPTGSGGGGSSGGSSKPSAPSAPVISPMDDKSSGTLNNAINAAASSNGQGFDVRLRNVSGFTKDNAAAILKKAKALGKKATVSSDTMSEDGKSVEVRITLDPELIAKTVRLDGYIRQSQTFITESKFKKHFDNKITVVNLGQEGAFGQTAKIAAKVDLTGFGSDNLYFYSYDKKTNQYIRINNPAYRIDTNGYLHFETDNGGDIIISDGPLKKK